MITWMLLAYLVSGIVSVAAGVAYGRHSERQKARMAGVGRDIYWYGEGTADFIYQCQECRAARTETK